ncbi:hypothetical protein QUF90_04785 [Desulfococcaceae bacterium HSG9]|nr:hypothetical protein [Desulfococcaceae bacterium HSG9]
MFIEACLISFGLHAGSKLYKKIRRGINKTADKPEPDNKNELQKIVTDLDMACQTFVQDNIDPLFGDTRGRQFKTLSLSEKAPEISEQEKQANRFMGLASANVGLAVVSRVFYPPLLVLTVPAILMFNMSFLKNAFRVLFKEHRVNASVLDSVSFIYGFCCPDTGLQAPWDFF